MTDYYKHRFVSSDPTNTPYYKPYAPYNDKDSYFAGPQKFIALKPKKLVVSDTGYIFYTLADGIFRCHKVDRVVEIDLENLSMANTVKNDVALEFNTITSRPSFSSLRNITESISYFYYTESGGDFSSYSGNSTQLELKAYIVED